MDFYVDVTKKGKTVKRKIEIERVPYIVYQIAQRVEKRTNEVRKVNSEIQEKDSLIKELRKEKPDGWKDDVKDIKNEIKEHENFILGVDDTGFFEERFEAIKIILENNGIKEGDELLDINTWSRNIDYSAPMSLIVLAMNKDIKKKIEKK